ncbi:MAG TPA: hypothetical protein GXZ52_08600 [Clostridiales bacterium]|nr:hypothetical protein [Clostridiales bacterium]
MNSTEWIELIQATFFDVIVCGNSLDTLLDCAYSFLGNPIMLVNPRGEIYSKAKNNPPYNDPLWEEFDAKGYVPLEKRKYISAEYYADKMVNDTVIIFEPAYISHRLMLYQTRITSTFTLRVIMLESKRPFSEVDEEVFELLAKTAAYYIKNSQLIKEFNSDSFEFFMHELLSGHIDSEKNEAEIISYLSIKPGDKFFILLAERNSGDVSPVSNSEIRYILQRIFNNSITVLFEDRVIVFVNLREQDGSLVDRIDRTVSTLKKYKFHCAISRFFDSFNNISLIYRQMVEAFEVANKINPKDPLHLVKDLVIPTLLDRLDASEIKQFCYTPMLELLYPERIDYLYTLYAYIISLGNISLASQLLGVHYNTVKYRLDKIRLILGPDLDSMFPALYISIKTLCLTNRDYMEECYRLDLIFWRHWRKIDEQRTENTQRQSETP